jgi:predicted aspartyl protease
MRGRGWMYVLAGLAVMGHAVAQGYALGYPEAGDGHAVEGTVRFDLYRDSLIVARGAAGPLKGLNFLLDTGASPTVLDSRVAQKLHLKELPASIGAVNGRVQAGRATVPELEFGPVRRESLPVLIEDLSFIEKALPVRIDGIVGLDVLGQSAFEIDYGAREIHFGQVPLLPVSLPLRMSQGMAIVDVEIDNAPVRLLVDTGASSLILFETRMPNAVSMLLVSSVQRSTNVVGDFERRQVRLESVRLGKTEFRREAAFVVQNHRDAGDDFDGLMSPAALGITKIAFDPGRGELAFSR